MKSILLSIKPKYAALIASGKKTIEVRKTAPKEVPFKAYIYCSKAKSRWLLSEYEGAYKNSKGEIVCAQQHIIGEFICDKVDEYTFSHYEAEYRVTHVEQEAMCLNQPELIRYGKGNRLYGWHISDLKIYDKPRELSEFCIPCKTNCEDCKKPLFYDCWEEKGKIKVVTRPPQSYMFVEEVKGQNNEVW